jgi:hypothetical protein
MVPLAGLVAFVTRSAEIDDATWMREFRDWVKQNATQDNKDS